MRISLFLLFCLPIQSLWTQIDPCQGISDPIQLMQCRQDPDGYIARHSPSQVTDVWRVERQFDALTSKTITAAIQIANGLLGERYALIARCHGDRTSVYVLWGAQLATESSLIPVEYRIDERNEIRENWQKSPDKQGTFAKNPVHLMREISSGERLRIVALPESQISYLAIFNLKEAGKALGEVATACGWGL